MNWFPKLRRRNSSKKSKKTLIKNLLNKLRNDVNSLIKCQADLESKIKQEILYIKKVKSYNKTATMTAFQRKELMEKKLEDINEVLAQLKCQIEIYEKYLTAFKCLSKNGVKNNGHMTLDNVKKIVKDSAIYRRLEHEVLAKSSISDISKQDDDDDVELEQELAELMGFSKSSDTIAKSCQISHKKKRAPQPILTQTF